MIIIWRGILAFQQQKLAYMKPLTKVSDGAKRKKGSWTQTTVW